MIFADLIESPGPEILVVGILVVVVVCKIWMVVYRSDLVKARLEDERHKREQRNKLLGPVVGLGAKGLGFWLFRK
jgi:hypothetical protein